MKVKSKKTKLVHDLTPEAWQKIVDRGRSGLYEIIESEELAATPVDVAAADYDAMMKKGANFKREGKLEQALESYKAAAKIKPTPYLASKIDEIESLIKENAEE